MAVILIFLGTFGCKFTFCFSEYGSFSKGANMRQNLTILWTMHYPQQIIKVSIMQLHEIWVRMIIEHLYKKKYRMQVKTFSSWPLKCQHWHILWSFKHFVRSILKYTPTTATSIALAWVKARRTGRRVANITFYWFLLWILIATISCHSDKQASKF